MSQVCSNLEKPSGVCLAIKCSKLQNSRESHDKVQCDISATLRARRKTRAHLFCVNSALRCIPRETRGSPDRATRLAAFLGAITAGAAASAGMIAAALGVTPGAAQDMVAKLGLREMTGRGRYRAWGIL